MLRGEREHREERWRWVTVREWGEHVTPVQLHGWSGWFGPDQLGREVVLFMIESRRAVSTCGSCGCAIDGRWEKVARTIMMMTTDNNIDIAAYDIKISSISKLDKNVHVCN